MTGTGWIKKRLHEINMIHNAADIEGQTRKRRRNMRPGLNRELLLVEKGLRKGRGGGSGRGRAWQREEVTAAPALALFIGTGLFYAQRGRRY